MLLVENHSLDTFIEESIKNQRDPVSSKKRAEHWVELGLPPEYSDLGLSTVFKTGRLASSSK